jgi:hypothetical protein
MNFNSQMRQVIAAPFQPAFAMQRGVRLDHAITLADECLYAAKSTGRNCVVDSVTRRKSTRHNPLLKHF